MNIAILGPSGAGKRTHASSLAVRYGLRAVSLGDLIRKHLQQHTQLANAVRRHQKSGAPLSAETIAAMIEGWCAELPRRAGALFDGLPRTLEQARALDEALLRHGRTFDAVIHLEVSDAEILRRLAERIVCPTCHITYHPHLKPPTQLGVCDLCNSTLPSIPVSQDEHASRLLTAFRENIAPVLDHYRRAGRLIAVSGEGTMSEVNAHLIQAIDQLTAAPHALAHS